METQSYFPAGFKKRANSDGSIFLKVVNGTTIRLLSAPSNGMEVWVAGKPKRYPLNKVPSVQADQEQPKYFWAAKVLDRTDNHIKVVTLPSSLEEAVRGICQMEGYENPRDFDIRIGKSGTGKQTRYTAVACPKQSLSSEMLALDASHIINLNALFEGSTEKLLTIVEPPKKGEQQTETSDLPF